MPYAITASLVTLALTAGAIAGPAASSAGAARKPRRVTTTASYTGTGGAGGAGIQVIGFNGDSYGGAVFESPGPYSRVSISVADENAPATGFVVGQDSDANGLLDWQEAFCDATDAPVDVTPGALVGVFVQQGPCADGTPAFGTRGKITVTFIP